eukprot:9766804-Alexandrium_andersonii.AAC.1
MLVLALGLQSDAGCRSFQWPPPCAQPFFAGLAGPCFSRLQSGGAFRSFGCSRYEPRVLLAMLRARPP